MFEIFNILWKLFMVRESAKKGELNWRVGAIAFLFVVLLYAIALPATVLWVNHPGYKPVFIAAVALDAVLFVAFMVWAIKWQAKQRAARAAQMAAAPAKGHAGQD
jgi:membrane protease YdiL (CAAX protease family)